MTNFKKLSVAAVIALAVLVPTSAFAGTMSGARISILNIYGSTTTPYAVFSFATVASGSPSCSQWPAAMALDISTNRGKAQMQLLTSAFLSGKNVMLKGTGSCVTPTGFGTTVETVNYVNIQ